MKIVITTLGSLGDIHPCLALGLELKKRNHQVVVATSEFYRQKIASTGLGFQPIGPETISPEDPELLRNIMDSRNGPENLLRNLLMPHMPRVYGELLEICKDAHCLLTGELVFASPLVAEKLRIPWASCILAPWQLLSAYDPSIIGPGPILAMLRGAGVSVNRFLKQVGRNKTRSWATAIDELRSREGLSQARHPLFEDKNSPYLNLAMFSQRFARRQEDWPDHTDVTGFLFFDGSENTDISPDVLQFLQNGKRPIIFTLGSTAVINPGTFFEQSIKAAMRLGRRALLLAGKHKDSISVRSDDHMVAGYQPYSRIFPFAAAVVHQGGMGTTAQAMRAGCPQLVVPHAFDQMDNAARIQRLGYGFALNKDRYNARRSAKYLSKLLGSPAYAVKAQETGEILRSENGAICAANLVEAISR